MRETRRCVVIGGAGIADYRRIRGFLRNEDYIIFCDSGLGHREGLGVVPSLIVGDFDSCENPHEEIETIVLPCEKDDTDTVFAVREALRRGFTDFLILGVIGARFDHSLGNLYILELLEEHGASGVLIDDYSEMKLVSRETEYIADRYAFFSLLNITGEARGITVCHAKYPLEDAEIRCGYQYGISNEVLPGETAEVSVRKGKLLLVKVW